MTNSVMANTRKRKSQAFPLDDLNQDLLEKVLSRLPAPSFFRLRAVCRRWNSTAASATFRLACSEVPSRDPWFLMSGQEPDRPMTVYDSGERSWRVLDRPTFFQRDGLSKPPAIPVASSGGLVCFRTPPGQLIVCNPVTGACREIPRPDGYGSIEPLHAIAMSSSGDAYRIVLVFGELPELKFRVFDSSKNRWEDEAALRRAIGSASPESDTVYFLSKAGDVVASDMMQRSPTKQYSSVLTAVGGGQEVVHFLGRSGTVLACDLSLGTFDERPGPLPAFFEHSIDVVECGGEVLAVVLSEMLETASLRVWRFSEGGRSWQHVAAMPPSMSHEFYGRKADINCVGCGSGGSILICVNSPESSSRYVMCNLLEEEWVELPKCVVNGRTEEFVSAFSFEPRVEASA
ncbi:F-box only protein 13 [Iris pallida]|uniref:F-box only protein 13 n=1 Tax=Iris pallida TaxID=29817 RepID=A0AAX6F7Q2_IRIPA|nr:F-box only protein 13 [Iris pallida]